MIGKEIANILQDINPVVMKSFYTAHTVDIKPDKSIVTETDRQIEEIITPRLKQLIPNSVIIGEESAPKDPDEVSNCFTKEYLWAVDPIDGTSNFASGIPHFTVSIGLLKQSHKGFVPIAGGISFPALSEIYYTHKGNTYRKNVRFQEENEVHINIGKSTSSILLPNDLITQLNLDPKNRFVNHLRFMGGSAADLVFVSLGKSLALCSKSNLWDIAGGLAIARTQQLFPKNLLTGKPLKSFTISDFSFDFPDNHWRLSFPLTLSRDEYFQDIQQLLMPYINS